MPTEPSSADPAYARGPVAPGFGGPSPGTRTTEVVADDGTPWDFRPGPDTVHVVGDVHADLTALLELLGSMGVAAGDDYRWAGADAHLVLTGDLVGRGSESREVMDYVMRLEREAGAAGGAVHALTGNHEEMVARGSFAYVPAADARAFAAYGRDAATALGRAFRDPVSPYARWIARRNAVVRIGRRVYVHAGLGDWVFRHTPGEVNATVRAWVRHHQGRGPAPPAGTRWAVSEAGGAGPLWDRTMATAYRDVTYPDELDRYRWSLRFPDAGGEVARPVPPMTRDRLGRILGHLEADQVVLGHTVTGDLEISLEHPELGRSVVEVDTGISRACGGNLGGLTISGRDVRVAAPARPSRPAGLAERMRADCGAAARVSHAPD